MKEVSPGKLVVAVLTCVFIRVIFKRPTLPALSGDTARLISLLKMFSSSLSQLHCKVFAKMGDDKPFVCHAPGCGQVSSLSVCLGFLRFRGHSPPVIEDGGPVQWQRVCGDV